MIGTNTRQLDLAQRTQREGWLILVHRYLGLAIGLWMCAVGASGAILAYYREIEVWLDPQLYRIAETAERHPDLDRMAAAVRAAYPDRFILYIDRHGLSLNESYPFVLTEPLPMTAHGPDLSGIVHYDTAASLQVFVNPNSAEIIGTRSYWTVINILRDFHRELFAPPMGRKILGVLGVLVFLIAMIGAVLWWRDARRNLKRGLTLRASSPTPRLVRDGHTVFGIYASIIIGWMGLSAAMICYGPSLRDAANWIIRGGKPAQVLQGAATTPPVSAATANLSPVFSLNRMRDVALTDHPNSDVVLIRIPKWPATRLSFRLYPLDEPITLYTRQVYIDTATGEIVGRFDPKRQPWTDSLFGLWLIWFHNGTMLGDVGRVLNIFAGVVLASLFPTGLYLWWKKRPSRKARTSLTHIQSSGTPHKVLPAE